MLTECQIKGIIDYSICTNLKINCFLQQLQQQQQQQKLSGFGICTLTLGRDNTLTAENTSRVDRFPVFSPFGDIQLSIRTFNSRTPIR